MAGLGPGAIITAILGALGGGISGYGSWNQGKTLLTQSQTEAALYQQQADQAAANRATSATRLAQLQAGGEGDLVDEFDIEQKRRETEAGLLQSDIETATADLSRYEEGGEEDEFDIQNRQLDERLAQLAEQRKGLDTLRAALATELDQKRFDARTALSALRARFGASGVMVGEGSAQMTQTSEEARLGKNISDYQTQRESDISSQESQIAIAETGVGTDRAGVATARQMKINELTGKRTKATTARDTLLDFTDLNLRRDAEIAKATAAVGGYDLAYNTAISNRDATILGGQTAYQQGMWNSWSSAFTNFLNLFGKGRR
jgi:hypothetical protein